MEREQIVSGVAREVQWWLDRRLKKLENLSHASMSVNPFLVPVVFGLHAFQKFDELAEFLLGGHFAIGYATGFGKLVDEKILPKVFGTTKLDAKFRKQAPWNMSIFDEIDHIIPRPNGNLVLLSVKAGRWTIQLGQAVGLNRSFHSLINMRDQKPFVQFEKIVVGVIYGKAESLTDKFRLIRGISLGKEHDVIDLQEHVDVVAGREFWTWVNNGQADTQDWVMDGVLKGVEESEQVLASAGNLIDEYRKSYTGQFSRHIKDGKIDWHAILKEISG